MLDPLLSRSRFAALHVPTRPSFKSVLTSKRHTCGKPGTMPWMRYSAQGQCSPQRIRSLMGAAPVVLPVLLDALLSRSSSTTLWCGFFLELLRVQYSFETSCASFWDLVWTMCAEPWRCTVCELWCVLIPSPPCRPPQKTLRGGAL